MGFAKQKYSAKGHALPYHYGYSFNGLIAMVEILQRQDSDVYRQKMLKALDTLGFDEMFLEEWKKDFLKTD